jgi:hypothetical protein
MSFVAPLIDGRAPFLYCWNMELSYFESLFIKKEKLSAKAW